MSDLTRIQQEIWRRFQRPHAAADDIPGFAGGNLGEQLDRQGQSPDRMSGVRSVFAPPQQESQPTGQVTTPTNQTDITRPRSVFAPPLQSQEPQPAYPQLNGSQRNPNPFAVFRREEQPAQETTRPRNVFVPTPGPDISAEGTADFRAPGSEPVSKSRDRRAEPRDYVADDSQYLRGLENKPSNWKDKAVDVLRATNQAFGSNPKIFTPTERERETLKAQGMLGRDIAIQKEKTAQDMARMVPIYQNGQVVGYGPARTAASTQLRASQQTNTTDDRRKSSLLKEMNGVRDFDPADPANAGYVKRYTEEFGTPPLKRVSGSLYVLDKGTDADGNATYNVIQKDTGTAKEVTGGNLPERSDQQLNREQRGSQFKTLQENLDRRAKARNVQSERNATIMAGGQVARMGDPEVHQRNMGEIDQDIDSIEKETDGILARQADTQKGGFLPSDPATLNQLRQRKNALERERRAEREKLGKIESAQGNLKTRGRSSASQVGGTGGSFNLGAWKTDHPNATPDQVRAMRAKAKARNMSIVE